MPTPIKPVFDEMALSCAAFDQPASVTRAKIFLCTTERSGSWYFCRAMMHHAMGVPHEYFNPKHIRRIAGRAGIQALAGGVRLGADAAARKAYCEALLSLRTLDGIFAAKVHWKQYADHLDNAEGDALLGGCCFIHLYREDLLAQAISLHIANQTGIWGVGETMETPPAAAADYFDPAAIDNLIGYLSRGDQNWRSFFARNGLEPYTISYERFRRAPSEAVREIARRFDLNIPPDVPDYHEAEPGPQRDRGVAPRSEIRARYLSGCRRIGS